MDGLVVFQRFLTGVLGSPVPSDAVPEPQPTSGRARSAGRTRPIDEVLDALVAEAGTRRLAPGERTLLLSHGPELAALLRRTLEQRRHFDRRLLNLFDDRTDPKLLVGFLLLVLHHRTLRAAIAAEAEWMEQFRAAVALRSVIVRDRLRTSTPEAQAFDQLRRECRRGRNRLLEHVSALVASSAGFTETHQVFVQDRLERLVEQRLEWLRAAREAVAFAHGVPTPNEIQLGERLGEVDAEEDTVQAQLNALSAEDDALGPRIDALPAGETRRQLRHDRREVRLRIRGLATRRRELRTEKRALTQSLGRRRTLVQEFLAARERGVHPGHARERRDRFLGAMDNLLAPHTGLRLTNGSEDQRWASYGDALQLLVKGVASIAIELPVDAYFRRYPEVESNRDWGYSDRWTGGTYPGHPENAIDLTGAIGTPIQLAMPRRFALPARLREPTELSLPHVLARSVVVRSHASASTDAQDVFSKLAYGLLRRRGSQRIGSAEIEEVMEANEDSDLAPDYVGDASQRNFETRRVLAGLMYHQLTPVQDLRGAIQRERAEILDELERQVAAHLGLAAGTTIFRRDRTDASSGRVGVVRLIAHDEPGTVLTAIGQVLGTDRNSGRRDRTGLCHRIWRLLWKLLGVPGVQMHRYGVSVTVEHQYAHPSDPTAPGLVVKAYYTHLREARMQSVGADVHAGERVGTLGTTGNAVSGHLHFELSVRRGGVQLGTLLMHEFFPFTPQYRAWASSLR